MTHPHFVIAEIAGLDGLASCECPGDSLGDFGALGAEGDSIELEGKGFDLSVDADEPEQLGLWDVDWAKIASLGDAFKTTALRGLIQGELLGMDKETVQAAIRIFIQTYGVLNLFRKLLGMWPYDATKVPGEEAHLEEKSPEAWKYWQTLFVQYAAQRAKLLQQASSPDLGLTPEEFNAQAIKAGWSQAQIDQTMAGKNIIPIEGGGTPWAAIAGGVLLLIVLYQLMGRR